MEKDLKTKELHEYQDNVLIYAALSGFRLYPGRFKNEYVAAARVNRDKVVSFDISRDSERRFVSVGEGCTDFFNGVTDYGEPLEKKIERTYRVVISDESFFKQFRETVSNSFLMHLGEEFYSVKKTLAKVILFHYESKLKTDKSGSGKNNLGEGSLGENDCE